MKHYYRIGEISRLYGVGPDSLRYYEELGILKPHRGENNYRMYHIHDLWRLNVIRDLRELGFSMAQIQDYLQNRTLSSTEELLTRELSVIQERVNKLEELKANIDSVWMFGGYPRNRFCYIYNQLSCFMDKEELWDIYSQMTKREALIFTNTSDGSSIKHLATNGQTSIIDQI